MRMQLACCFLLFLLFGCVSQIPNQGNEGFKTALIRFEGSNITVVAEVVDDDTSRELGLMYRQRLADDGGMLFVFEKEGLQAFWMRNTLIPLDMIFISSEMRVINIETAVPCESDPCKSYFSDRKAKYVLEVNANFSRENRIYSGSEATISYVGSRTSG